MITLQPVTRDNWQDALDLTVTPEQLRFVAAFQPVVLLGLAKAYVQHNGRLWLPYVLHDGERMIGFVELAFDETRPAEAWIYHFFIDQHLQGQGLGTLALRALLVAIADQFNEVQRVYLTVHPENLRAQRLYYAAGFRPTGAELHSEPVYGLDLDR